MADAMKLLPCPMCGGEAALLDYEARYGGLHYASRCPQCTSCGCSMGYLPTAKKAVEAWNCRASMPAPEKAPSFDDARRKLIHCIEQWDGETEYDAEDIAALADDILDVFASPPAREEAPAEGAGETGHTRAARSRLDLIAHGALTRKVYHPSTWTDEVAAFWADVAALRARTSEPEAREAEDVRAARERMFGGMVKVSFYDENDDPQKTFMADLRTLLRDVPRTHPAPATADKLRDTLNALVTAVCYAAPPKDFNGVIAYEARIPVEFVDQAIAALNEEGRS